MKRRKCKAFNNTEVTSKRCQETRRTLPKNFCGDCLFVNDPEEKDNYCLEVPQDKQEEEEGEFEGDIQQKAQIKISLPRMSEKLYTFFADRAKANGMYTGRYIYLLLQHIRYCSKDIQDKKAIQHLQRWGYLFEDINTNWRDSI